MRKLISKEKGFSKIIPNQAGIAIQKSDSLEIQKEHVKWRKDIQQIKKRKTVEEQSYWEKMSFCSTL